MMDGLPSHAEAEVLLRKPYQDIGAYSGGVLDCTNDELQVIRSFLSNTVYSDYGKLIQLGDSMGMADGVCLIDVRIVDVVRRYGFNDFTLRKWESIFSLKNHFDSLCHMNIYDLFYDEIREIYEGGNIEIRCTDCGAKYGHYHHGGCDCEYCPICERQMLVCGCGASVMYI